MFAKRFEFNPVTDEKLMGDTANAGLASVLCKHLAGIPAKVSSNVKKGYQTGKFTAGGAVTGLLKLAGVNIEWETAEQIPPRFLDIGYLSDHKVLVGPNCGPSYYYSFKRTKNSLGITSLPNSAITSLDFPSNFAFDVPEGLLIDPATVLPTSKGKGVASGSKSQEPSKKKRKAVPSPSPPPSIVPCECTREGFREDLIAEVMSRLKKEMEAGVKDQLDKGFAEMGKIYVKRSSIAHLRTVRQTPAAGTSAPQGSGRITVQVRPPASAAGKEPSTSIDRTPLAQRLKEVAGPSKRPAEAITPAPPKKKTQAPKANPQRPVQKKKT